MSNVHFTSGISDYPEFTNRLHEYLDDRNFDDNVPIRVTNSASTDLDTWTSGWARHFGLTQDECNESGITIALGTSLLSDVSGRADLMIPNAHDLCDEDESGFSPDPVYIYDARVLEDSEYVPLTFTSTHAEHPPMTRLLGEYDPDRRIITLVFAPHTMATQMQRSLNWEDIIGEALDEIIGIAGQTPEEREQARLERYRSQFGELLATRHEDRLRQERTQIEQLMGQLAAARTQVATTTSQLRESQAIYDATVERLNAGLTETDIEREWEALYRHADTESVRVRGTQVTIKTGPIELTRPDTGATTIVGEFDVTLDFGASPDVSVRNLTNRRGTLDHPHVHGGRFCLGNMEDTIYQLLGRREVATAYSLVTEALHNVSPDDIWGASVEAFFTDVEIPDDADALVSDDEIVVDFTTE